MVKAWLSFFKHEKGISGFSTELEVDLSKSLGAILLSPMPPEHSQHADPKTANLSKTRLHMRL